MVFKPAVSPKAGASIFTAEVPVRKFIGITDRYRYKVNSDIAQVIRLTSQCIPCNTLKVHMVPVINMYLFQNQNERHSHDIGRPSLI